MNDVVITMFESYPDKAAIPVNSDCREMEEVHRITDYRCVFGELASCSTVVAISPRFPALARERSTAE